MECYWIRRGLSLFDPGAIVDDNGVDGDNIFGPQAVFLGIEKTISGCVCTF